MATYSDQEEYELAVAFLREFHSRRAEPLHSTYLGVISESHGEMNSGFSMAVNDSPSCQHTSGKHNGGNTISRIAAGPCEYNIGQRRLSEIPKAPVLKKTASSKCLHDLDNGSNDNESVEFPPPSDSLSGRSSNCLFSGRGSRSIYPLSLRWHH